MHFSDENIHKICKMYSVDLAASLSSILTDIYYLVKTVKCRSLDVLDHCFPNPQFDFNFVNGTAVITVLIESCSERFKRLFRQKCGASHEYIFYLDHVTIYNNTVYFYSKNFIPANKNKKIL